MSRTIDLARGRSLRIVGAPGTGKTVALQQLVTDKLLDHWRVVVIELAHKAADYDFARPWVMTAETPGSRQSVYDLLDDAWDDYRVDGEPTLIVIDSFDGLLQAAKTDSVAHQVLDTVRHMNGEPGVSVVIAMQSAISDDDLRRIGFTDYDVIRFDGVGAGSHLSLRTGLTPIRFEYVSPDYHRLLLEAAFNA